MKVILDKLVSLAKEYAETCGVLGNGWHKISGYNADFEWCKEYSIEIQVWFSELSWDVRFGEISVDNNFDRIAIPFKASEEYLNDIYEYAKSYFDVVKTNIGDITERSVDKRIEELEFELNRLKTLKN